MATGKIQGKFEKFYNGAYQKAKNKNTPYAIAQRILHPKMYFASKLMDAHQLGDDKRLSEMEMFRLLPGMIFKMDLAGRILAYFSENKKDLYDPSLSFIGKSVYSVLPPSAAKEVEMAIATLNNGSMAAECDYELEIAGGKRHYHVQFSRTKKDAVYALVNETTKICNAIEVLKKEHAKLSQMFDDSPIPIMRFDIDGNLKKVNKKFLEAFGVENPKEVLQFNIFTSSLISTEQKNLLKAGYAITHDMEFDFRKAVESGIYRTSKTGFAALNVKIARIEAKNGEIFGYIAQVIDETEQKKLAQQKDRFFEIIAHDLRSPFQGLLGFSEILADEIEAGSKDSLHYAKSMKTQVRQLYETVAELLNWSRINSGKWSPKIVELDLHALADAKGSLLAATIADKRQKFENNILGGTMVKADRVMAGEIISNLLTNAIKFTPVGGRISIGADSMNDGMVRISVSDTGIGIDSEKLGDIFRIDSNYKSSGTVGESGTGLGLRVAAEMVEKQGGRIWAESNGAGRGSTFSFTLPAAESETQPGEG